jgi:hypothetical protein
MPRLLSILALVIFFAPADLAAQSVAGNWQGTVTFGGNPPLRIGLILSDAAAGYEATLVIIDQDGQRIPVERATFTGAALHLDIPNIRGSYDGTLSADGSAITGAMTQGGMPIALNFRRVAALDPPPVFGDEERAAVAEVISGYFQSFTDNDFDRFRGLLQAPFTRWPMGGPAMTAASLDEVVTGMRDARQALEGSAYAVSRVAEMIITPTSANSAMVDLHWRRDKADGSVFQEGAEILTVVRTPTGWKVNGNLGRALSHYRKTF